jgi:hypothetical protein
MRVVRLFSAAIRLDPLAVAPERVETEATYSPPDSSTLPEYCVPATVVEKLVSCISSAALPPALAPQEEWLCLLLAAVVLAVFAAAVVDVAGVDAVGEEVAFGGAAATGFSTVKLEARDEIALISMAQSYSWRNFIPDSYIDRILRILLCHCGASLRFAARTANFVFLRVDICVPHGRG